MSGRDLRDICEQAERRWASKIIRKEVGGRDGRKGGRLRRLQLPAGPLGGRAQQAAEVSPPPLQVGAEQLEPPASEYLAAAAERVAEHGSRHLYDGIPGASM
jgi:hypothetical protein